MLTPNQSATRLDVRGFHVKDPDARDLLETIGRTFLTGYACAAETRSAAETRPGLDRIPTRFRGFAYEGAAMGCAVLDGLPFGRAGRVDDLLAGPGSDHVYMAYVGIGWAMARLPRFRWSRLSAPDPLLRWLVLDGYGFHQAYFHTGRYVHRRFREESFPWPAGASAPYAGRAIDQGIGRALWFVCGTDADLTVMTIERFPEERRAALFSGVGLAVTYAGGADEKEMRGLWQQAGEYRPNIAQGSAFAAEARLRADLVVPHVELATETFCHMTPAQAAQVCRAMLPEETIVPAEDARSPEPAYETWRRRIAEEFAIRGRT